MDKVLRAAFAGSFYPSDAVELREAVEGYINNRFKPIAGSSGMVVPHAGYMYSGKTAGCGFSSAPDDVSTVVVIAPSHRYPLAGETVFCVDFMETPLGICSVNKTAATSISSEMDTVVFNEHSLEVMIPFVQVRWPGVSVIPIVLGSRPDCRKTAELVQKFAPNAFVVASSDLSHFHPLNTAEKLDRKVIDAFLSLSPDRITDELEACGRWAIRTLLFIAELRGADVAVELDYSTSADAGAGTDEVVGYFSGMVSG